jgi:hypothetical protein
MDKIYLVLILLLILSLSLFLLNFSSFSSVNKDNCYKDDRVYPEGKVPGSYLGLTKEEVNNLLPSFILDKNV